MNLGHTLFGHGSKRVIVMHDWFSDTSSYREVLHYLDPSLATYAFVDLRGYGKSANIQGECTLEEATADIMRLANHLKWISFSIVGHSMTGLVAMDVSAQWTERVQSQLLIAPVSPAGLPTPEDVISTLEKGAEHDDNIAMTLPTFMTSMRYNSGFGEFKLKRWRETSQPQARVAYLHMFTESELSSRVQNIPTPTTLVTGEFDAEAHKAENLEGPIRKCFPHVKSITLPCGHYPMEETPPMLAKIIEDGI